MLDKLSFYLGREMLREKIAAAGRAEALEKHTYRHRMERILGEAETAACEGRRAGRGGAGKSAGPWMGRCRKARRVNGGNAAPADEVARSQPRMGRHRTARRVYAGNAECVIAFVFFEPWKGDTREPRGTHDVALRGLGGGAAERSGLGTRG